MAPCVGQGPIQLLTRGIPVEHVHTLVRYSAACPLCVCAAMKRPFDVLSTTEVDCRPSDQNVMVCQGSSNMFPLCDNCTDLLLPLAVPVMFVLLFMYYYLGCILSRGDGSRVAGCWIGWFKLECY